MKHSRRISGVFLSIFLVLFGIVSAIIPTAAAASPIDVTTASGGYFTVEYNEVADVKMKVGVTYGSDTVYYDYVPGSSSGYSFTEGNGTYTVTLFQNVFGTSYKSVATSSVTVNMNDELAPYRASTAEVTFSKDDAVGRKANEICWGITDESSKIAAIHNYIAANYSYDNDFAANVKNGAVKDYTPDTNKLVAQKTGVCYDFSVLFAAMCRSQDIPCAVVKGYYSNEYHAWNMVHTGGSWVAVDMTASVASRNVDAETVSDCTVSLSAYQNYSY